jgi:hypothetical protein
MSRAAHLTQSMEELARILARAFSSSRASRVDSTTAVLLRSLAADAPPVAAPPGQVRAPLAPPPPPLTLSLPVALSASQPSLSQAAQSSRCTHRLSLTRSRSLGRSLARSLGRALSSSLHSIALPLTPFPLPVPPQFCSPFLPLSLPLPPSLPPSLFLSFSHCGSLCHAKSDTLSA